MPEPIVLDYNNMLASNLDGNGIEPGQLDALVARFADLQLSIAKRREEGRLGFYELPNEKELVARIRSFADGFGQAFGTVVVLGIGGSALGTIALRNALLSAAWNDLDDDAREYFPRLHVVDNIDPSTLGSLLDRLDLGRTLFNVVSKSGSTAETLAQLLIVRERLRSTLGDNAWQGHVLFTTDPESGPLRRLAEAEGIAALPIPPGVGGRFSVLSAVGLLPAALAGIDINALLEGARAMVERCGDAALLQNPAGLFAALQFLAHTRARAPIHVMMPYSDRLTGIADWFRQLWAESLGKQFDLHGTEVFRGPTPVTALGATDQHSQIQLFMEGPFDKTVTFLAVKHPARDLPIPAAYPDVDSLAYLGGHTLGRLLHVERVATARALTRAGRMNMTIELPVLDAHTLGQLIMMLQIATVYAGSFYEVDPLDQPGVELGKQLTYALLGRPGYEAPSLPPPDPRRIVF